MDHSHHNHHANPLDMSHGGMGGGGGGGHRCQMSMLFTWNTQDLCLVFRWWHITSTFSLILSLLAVVALGVGYEYLRVISRRYEARVDADAAGGAPTEESSLLAPAGRRKHGSIGKGLFYGAQVFYSFFIMLLFMTYNGWVMIAVAVGAVVGYVLWGEEAGSSVKSVVCH
ncbi:Ctr-domain-containing protein [Wilcoxina mikolae CBS 423.85]|nr:Ctr-domain-containing protein [Wilcoxina mikolae CBS 423.85]